MPTRSEAQLELYRRYQEAPVDPILNEWWDNLDYLSQQSVSELYKRGKEQFAPIDTDQFRDSQPPGLVSNILEAEPLNPELFKQTRTRSLGPDQTETIGVVQEKPDGSLHIVDDLKKVNLLMLDDKIPEGLTLDEFSDWNKDIQRKAVLESEGYKLYNLSTGQVIEPKSIPYKAPALVRNRYVNQWQSFVNRFPTGFKQYQTSSKMMLNELGLDIEERVKEIALLQAEIQGIKKSQAYDEFQKGNLNRLITDPFEIVAQITAESMSQFLPMQATIAAVTVPTGVAIGSVGGVPGAIAGGAYGLYTAAGLASLSMEYTGMILETMGEYGIDVTNPDELLSGLQNENLMSEARVTGLKKGIPIAILDMISAGVAGKIAPKIGSKVLGGGAELGTQMALGGGGEIVGSVAAGKEINPSAVLSEAFGEVGSAAPAGMVNIAISQNKALQQAKFNKTKVGKEILRAREEGTHDEKTLDMAEKLAKQNPEIFEEKSVLQFSDEIKIITDEELIERGIDPKEFKEGEGIDPETGNLRALGSTEEENGQVIIKLYKGARPQDVVEEFFGNHYRRLDEESQKILDDYYQKYKDAGGLLTKQELFEKEGTAYYFGYIETDSTMVKIYRKIKLMLDNMFNKSTLDNQVRNMYEDAGFGRIINPDAKTGDVSFSVVPVFYNKSSKAIDKLNAASLKSRNVKNFLRRQGVSNDEMAAIKIDELLNQYKPIDSIPISEIKKHIEKNEIQLVDWGTIDNLPAETAEWDDARWERFYEEEAEYEMPEEQRWDVVQYGDPWRDIGMYADGAPGFNTEEEASQAIQEEIEYRMNEGWDELENGYDVMGETIIEQEVNRLELADDLESFPEGKKYILYDGVYDPDAPDSNTSVDNFIDPQKVVKMTKTKDELRDWWYDNREQWYGEEMHIEEFTYIDEEAEPEIVNMPDADDMKIKPRWGGGSQVQPGGRDYQELVVKWDLPERLYRQDMHFDVDNPLVHIRFNTRDDKNNNKVLFIEEIQSDWHQEGSKGGYRKDMPEMVRIKIENLNTEINDVKADMRLNPDKEVELTNYLSELREEKKELAKPYEGSVKDAPYKDFNWITLAGKRIIRYAVDNSFDKIAWVTGKQQVDRNNLRRYIDKIRYYKFPKISEIEQERFDVLHARLRDYGFTNLSEAKLALATGVVRQEHGESGATEINNIINELASIDLRSKHADRYSITAYAKNQPGRVVFDETVEEHKLEGLVSKPVADRIVQDKGLPMDPEEGVVNYRMLSGVELEIGGENRERLYDVEISNRMKKLAGNIGTTELQTQFDDNRDAILVDHQSIDITDKVIDKYSKPIPSFSVVPESEYKNFNNKQFKKPNFEGDYLVPISTRLKRIHPKLKKIIRDFEYKAMKGARDDRRKVKPFLEAINELARKDSQAYSLLDYSLKNGISESALEVARKHGFEDAYLDVREYLDDMYKRAEAAGIDMGYIDKYFPRKVEDYDGLIKHLDREDQGIITKILNQERLKIGRELTIDEQRHIVNGLLAGHRSLGSKSPHVKKRDNSIIIDKDINQFYQDSPTTLLQYIDSMNEMIAINELFGKGENKEETVGAYVAKLVSDGLIEPAQEAEVKKLLDARFNYSSMTKWAANIKNVTYAALMGSPTSAITQIGDMAWSLYKGGYFNTVNEARKAIMAEFGKDMDQITPEDLGADKVAQEFQTTAGTAEFLNKLFKLTQLERMDRLGKTTLVNSAIKKFRKRAKGNDKTLKVELEAIFGDKADQVIEDLKSDKRTENIEILAFNTLLDFQPVALSEMPVKYLKTNEGRLFYQLKTFTIKQFDVFRNEAIDKIKAGQVREGMTNLFHLSVVFMAANATGDILKDLMMGRPIHADDMFWDNVLRLVGLSRYHTWVARDRGPYTAAIAVVAPSSGTIVDRFVLDAAKVQKAMTDDKVELPKTLANLYSWNFLPVGGKPYFWRHGGGVEKINNQERKRFNELRKERKLTREERREEKRLIDEAVELGLITRKTAYNLKRRR